MTKKSQIAIIATSATIFVAGLVAILVYFLKNNNMTKNYFSDEELTRSDTARRNNIDNTPSADIWKKLHALRDNILNPIREQYGKPIYVTSGYRCPRVNSLVGGATSSQHMVGEAADIDTRSRAENKKIFELIVRQGKFDQLIWEGNGEWIHVSYSTNRHRGQILSQNTSGIGYTNITSNWQKAIA